MGEDRVIVRKGSGVTVLRESLAPCSVGGWRPGGATNTDSRNSAGSLEPKPGRITNFVLGVDRKVKDFLARSTAKFLYLGG